MRTVWGSRLADRFSAAGKLVGLSVLRWSGNGSLVRPADDPPQRSSDEIRPPIGGIPGVFGAQFWCHQHNSGHYLFPDGTFWVAWTPWAPLYTTVPMQRRQAEHAARAIARHLDYVVVNVMKCQSSHQQQCQMEDWLHIPYGIGAPCPEHGVISARSSVFYESSYRHAGRNRRAA